MTLKIENGLRQLTFKFPYDARTGTTKDKRYRLVGKRGVHPRKCVNENIQPLLIFSGRTLDQVCGKVNDEN